MQFVALFYSERGNYGRKKRKQSNGILKKIAERDSISEAVSVLPEAAVELCTKGPQGRRV